MKKILISSDSYGRFDLLLPKVHQLNNKNKFDFMLIVGLTCPSDATNIFHDLKTNKLSFPLPTYFIDNSDMSVVFGQLYPSGFQIVNNFHYLGNAGFREIQGIRIAYISGNIQDISKYNNNQRNNLQYQLSTNLAKQFIGKYQNKQIDILLTNQWAQQYKQISDCKPSKNQMVSQICYQLSPRYHISASGSRYQRLPAFKSRKGNPTHFINVAEIKESLPKQKYLVAIQLNPNQLQIIENSLPNPLIKNFDWNINQTQQPKLRLQNQLIKNRDNKVQLKEDKFLDTTSFIMFQGVPEETPNSQITQFLQKWGQIKQIQVFKQLKGNKKAGIFRFTNLRDAQICLKDSGKYTLYQSRIKFSIKQQSQKYRLKDCFLCMGNQKFDQNLLAYKGKFCFICVDKGPVVEHHFQIVPINHVSSTSELQLPQQQQISSLKTIYQNYFIQQGYTFVCIQRYMNLSAEINHAILHCIPLKLPQQQVLAKYRKINYDGKYGFEQLKQISTQSKIESPFYIILHINNCKYVKKVDRKDKKFEQARQIICQIIDKPQRLNWRDCEIKAEKIKQQVQVLKNVII